MPSKPQTWRQWARACIRDPGSLSKITKDMLAALTGTDARALDAIVACWTAYAYTGEPAVLEAARILIRLMQVHTRPLARELIAFALEWDDRERLWPIVSDDERLGAIGRSYGAEVREEFGER